MLKNGTGSICAISRSSDRGSIISKIIGGDAALRFAFFTVVSAFYYIGYTCQCVVTKSAQTCLTNDPK